MFGFNKGKLIFLIFALAFVIAVPLTIYQTQQQQDLRQRAENETIYTISSSITVNNKILNAVLALDNKQSLDVTAIDMNISYPSELNGLITFEPSSSGVITNKNSNNTIRIVAINSSAQDKKNNLNLGTLTINASTLTQAQINKIAAITMTMEIASHNPDSIRNIGVNPIKTSDLAQLIAGFGTTGCSLSFDWKSDTTLASDTKKYYITVEKQGGGGQLTATGQSVNPDQKNITLPNAEPNATYNIIISDDNVTTADVFMKNLSTCFGTSIPIPSPTLPSGAGESIPTPTDTSMMATTPTPTSVPGSIVLDLNIFLPNMIGKKNDENKNPIHKNNRPIKVILKSPTGAPINKSGTINYSEADGKYIGTIDLGKSFPEGTYKILVKKGEFLKGFVKEISIPESSGSTINMIVNVNLLVGLDDDGNPSILYYNHLHSCFGTTISKSKCSNPEDADLNSDGSVDGIDFNIFIRSLKELLGL